MKRAYKNHSPTLGQRVYIDPQACVIGQANLADDVSVWPMTVVRADVCTITVGARTNLQDGSILHVNGPAGDHPEGWPLVIGADVTVGHQAILHACTVGDRSLIGMGSTVLDGAIIEDEVLLAAGSLVTPGKRLERGYLFAGRPAKPVRPLSADELAFFSESAAHYAELKNDYLEATPDE
ncbi:MAG: gamma carbonic anhydrase family protein [Immundisolibacteraceae bacterium]|nr:gamma carbonic anhydrase family protein [Immundisolibacteraceae bacterium]